MVGTGLGAKRGILFKNASALEHVATLDTVVFDKTGTLTRGEPEVVEIKTTGALDEQTLLRLTGALERESEHPLAQAIVKTASARGLDGGGPAAGFETVAGEGRWQRSRATGWRSGTRGCSSANTSPSTAFGRWRSRWRATAEPSSTSRSTGRSSA
jgi:cation transport ATPase